MSVVKPRYLHDRDSLEKELRGLNLDGISVLQADLDTISGAR